MLDLIVSVPDDCLSFYFVSSRKWLRSTIKYGCRQPSLITLFIAFSSDLLELYYQVFDNTILLMSKT